MKHIVLCADDYAMNKAIDTGILHLVRQGHLSAFSCMSLSPRWPEAARAITPDLRQKADIGLHLDFTEYAQPLKSSLGCIISGTLLRRFSLAEIRQAIHRQLDLFEAAYGRLPDYIDGHQHVHQLPQIRGALAEIIASRFGRVKPWIRIARSPDHRGVKAAIITGLGARALERIAKNANLPYTNFLLGIYAFNQDAEGYGRSLDSWLELAARQPAGNLAALMCHPAMPGIEKESADAIRQAREIEFKVLSSADLLPRLLQAHQLELARPSLLTQATGAPTPVS
ncbi:Chitooligosaccharide deacetylase ChbG [Methylophilaceae bacterium]|nr:Chitooligosaccharide deacetylase ChbG [Methylophilaceae bacterium]